MSPEELAAKAVAVGEGEVVVHGYSRVASPADYASAGATWWLENLNDFYGPADEMLALVQAGPPA